MFQLHLSAEPAYLLRFWDVDFHFLERSNRDASDTGTDDPPAQP